jgi:hypothetical protein
MDVEAAYRGAVRKLQDGAPYRTAIMTMRSASR